MATLEPWTEWPEGTPFSLGARDGRVLLGIGDRLYSIALSDAKTLAVGLRATIRLAAEMADGVKCAGCGRFLAEARVRMRITRCARCE